MTEHGFAFPNGLDQQVKDEQGRAQWKLARAFSVDATPTTILITPGGGILGRRTGPFAEPQLMEALQTLLDYKEP